MNRIILTLPQLWYSGGTKEEDSCSRGAGRILVVLMRCMSHFSCVLCLHHITNASRESLHKLDDGFNSCAPRCPRLCLSATFQPAPLSKDSKSSPTLPNWISASVLRPPLPHKKHKQCKRCKSQPPPTTVAKKILSAKICLQIIRRSHTLLHSTSSVEL